MLLICNSFDMSQLLQVVELQLISIVLITIYQIINYIMFTI